ncbi:MAG: pantoate--beta-alanine ligase [Candidatus Omnitrophota bacterium]|nr:pantoate--beta-alanine ligase [Candidatus Omnitrophota bacterium]
MKIVDSVSRMSTFTRLLKKEAKTIGFVPTMGYLHEGHLSLVRAAKKHDDTAVMSIFVNPIQFGPKEDFDKYPRDFKRDEELARSAGVDVLFYPSVKDMYPHGYATYVAVEALSSALCGASRPGHFKGVATVVAKLFGIVRPDIAYFGQKDAQQAIIIKKMAEDLHMGVEIKMMPTIREPDGLAISSRNIYLTDDERSDALVLSRSLERAGHLIKHGEKNPKKVLTAINDMIKEKPSVKIDYVSIAGTKDLKEVDTIGSEVLIAIAAYVGRTRLIDNIIIKAALSAIPK